MKIIVRTFGSEVKHLFLNFRVGLDHERDFHHTANCCSTYMCFGVSVSQSHGGNRTPVDLAAHGVLTGPGGVPAGLPPPPGPGTTPTR
jgi:hypothetical protein